ncbi:pentatricopeptide repeat-containing protein, putative [Ricinus communis]|uniref:Pentatricopeptide repeat-containing protein, putative n=1 Tax=Ricinus communis TaxID=3988 RepID=B9RTF6_RICCO|nr:pentatricopeptide repeat-containing protein, putative [Ricinus communis]|eukprot:XP_002517025.1 pentatricopeptide repeat-containing protein At4g02750 [Ricinus communis]
MNHSLISKLLKQCRSLKTLTTIHAHLLISGSIASSDLTLNKLLRLYSKFGAVSYAHKLFDETPEPNSFLWTALIHGFTENNQYENAFAFFIKMHRENIVPLNFTIASVLKAVSRLGRIKDGDLVYGLAVRCGYEFDLVVKNVMIELFMRCGEMGSARQMFDEMEERDAVSWNSMITGYGNNGRVDIARKLFDRMEERNVISWTSMIQGYVKAGDLLEARVLFERMPEKDLASWKVMVSAYMSVGNLVAARNLFELMPIHDVGTWNLMISGCCKAGEMDAAKEFFDRMQERNVASWVMIIDGYIKVGDVDAARSVFDQMPEKNLVAWSTMIGGYAKTGHPYSSLKLYKTFKEQGIKPDETFALGIISACSQLGVPDTAESVICDFVGPSLFPNLQVVTSLIDMYAKCGNIERAVQVFEMVDQKDLHCYSTVITAFANHGLSEDAISLFSEMQKANIKPDGVAFLGVLTACNHGGLVGEGRRLFRQMIDEYGIQPSEKHYACMVDILGRAGCLEEAHSLICSMPVAPNATVWGALLSACRVHLNVQLAEAAATELFQIEPNNSGNYVLLFNIYADAGQWDDFSKVRAMIRENRVRKNRGSSWIELGSVIHEFVMGDKSHFDSERIFFMLELLCKDMMFLDIV